MIDCDNFKKYLSDYLDGEIPGKLRKSIEDHLNNCQECSELSQGIKTARDLVKGLPKVTASVDFESKLRQRIMEEGSEDSIPLFNFFSSRTAVACASIAMVLVLVFVGMKFGFNSGSSEQPAFSPTVSESASPGNLHTVPVRNLQRKSNPGYMGSNPQQLSQIDTSITKNKTGNSDEKDKVKYVNSK